MRFFQINEDDLAELERTLPDLMGAMMPGFAKDNPAANRLRVQWRRVQAIVQNVRWDYGPPLDVLTMPPDGGPPPTGDGE